LLALLEQGRLEDAPAILTADLTRDGPRVCEAVLRAIADDTDLRRLQPGGALTSLAGRVGELAGATGPGAVSRAVDALQAVIWSAIRDELRSPDPDLVSELTERLTLVSELLRSAALDRVGFVPGAGPAPGLSAVPPGTVTGEPMPPPPRTGAGDEPAARQVWPSASAATVTAPDALWVGALEDEIHRRAGSPLSLLLAELEDADRVSAVEAPAQASATFHHFGAAVRSAVRRQDILVSETEGRAWIIARDTGRPGATALGARIAETVRETEPWRGAPLVASVGVAVLGEDGRTGSELIEAAEEARFAAAASRVDVADSTTAPDDA
jgi:GGDEF domain-containing protein